MLNLCFHYVMYAIEKTFSPRRDGRVESGTGVLRSNELSKHSTLRVIMMNVFYWLI